jgi:hypothetical protein
VSTTARKKGKQKPEYNGAYLTGNFARTSTDRINIDAGPRQRRPDTSGHLRERALARRTDWPSSLLAFPFGLPFGTNWRDKNQRDEGTSQSVWTETKMEAGSQELIPTQRRQDGVDLAELGRVRQGCRCPL